MIVKPYSSYSIAPDNLCIALSGGPDSMALWSFLSHRRYDIPALFINHGTENSDFAEAFLKKNFPNSPIYYERVISIFKDEFNFSYHRYEILKDYNEKYFIYLAHHLDDVIDQFIMFTLKGKENPWLSPLSARSGRLGIWRPLLLTKKKRLYSYLENNKVPFIEDTSNYDLSNMRSYIRANKEIFYKVNPGLDQLCKKKVEAMYKSF